jgi:hypothetical protein
MFELFAVIIILVVCDAGMMIQYLTWRCGG